MYLISSLFFIPELLLNLSSHYINAENIRYSVYALTAVKNQTICKHRVKLCVYERICMYCAYPASPVCH